MQSIVIHDFGTRVSFAVLRDVKWSFSGVGPILRQWGRSLAMGPFDPLGPLSPLAPFETEFRLQLVS